ncbi:MAG: FeoB small GTPase domain-containing protein, partial [Coriobacteriia bacterium]|nr:FeoB small GTPase domain-containing protein [Coriobacteriia bacterium]
MAHCPTPAAAEAAEAAVRAGAVVLAGNPNVGKSAVFNALTGAYVDVSNFPGTTVELTHGRFGDVDVVDTPGIYGVSSFNEEETVARDVILGAGAIVNVIDAVHLERDLFLTLQLADMGLPMVVALNMVDEARREGVSIDRDLLEDLLGVPVVETVAVEGKGIDELKAAVSHARVGHPQHDHEDALLELTDRIGSRAEALLVLEGDECVAERHGVEPGTMRDPIYVARRARVDDIAGHVVSEEVRGVRFSARLSRWMLHPLTGLPLLGLLLFVMYKVLGELI